MSALPYVLGRQRGMGYYGDDEPPVDEPPSRYGPPQRSERRAPILNDQAQVDAMIAEFLRRRRLTLPTGSRPSPTPEPPATATWMGTELNPTLPPGPDERAAAARADWYGVDLSPERDPSNMAVGLPRSPMPSGPTMASTPLRLPRLRPRDVSPSIARAEDMAAAFPSEQAYKEQNRPRGFGGRLAAAGRMALESIMMSQAADPRAKLMTGAMAFLPGLISRDLPAQVRYRNRVVPGFQMEQERLRGAGAREIALQNVIDDNTRLEEQMGMQREERALARGDRERNYKLAVAKFMADMAEARDKAKTANEKEFYDRQHNAAKMYLETGRQIPDDVAENIGAPGLAGATKPVGGSQADYEADVTPQDYGVPLGGDWSSLVDNPRRRAWDESNRDSIAVAERNAGEYNRTAEYKTSVEAELARMGLRPPPAKITAAELRDQNPYIAKSKTSRLRRGGRAGTTRTTTMEEAKRQARAVVAGIVNDPNKSVGEKQAAKEAYQEAFKEPYQ